MTEEITNLDDALAGATPETPAEAEPAPVEEVKPAEEPKGKVNDDGNITVPLKALHEERDARQKLQAEVEQMKVSLQQPAAEPEIIPDPIDDPQGYHEYTQRQINSAVGKVSQQMQSRLLDMSEAGAVRSHGKESVESVKEWFASQPQAFQQEALGAADPYDYAIQEHKRQQVTATLTADPDKLDRILKLMEGKEEPAPKMPETTAMQQSVGARKGPEWSGPTPLDSIL